MCGLACANISILLQTPCTQDIYCAWSSWGSWGSWWLPQHCGYVGRESSGLLLDSAYNTLYPASCFSGRGPAGLGKPKLLLYLTIHCITVTWTQRPPAGLSSSACQWLWALESESWPLLPAQSSSLIHYEAWAWLWAWVMAKWQNWIIRATLEYWNQTLQVDSDSVDSWTLLESKYPGCWVVLETSSRMRLQVQIGHYAPSSTALATRLLQAHSIWNPKPPPGRALRPWTW